MRSVYLAIAEGGANVIEVFHIRDSAEIDLGQTSVSLLLETRGADHIARLRERLTAAGYELGDSD